jgi:hypothetical protein
MPNYCDNTITFVGKKETIQYLVDSEMQFEKLCPVPPKNPFGKQGLLVSEQSNQWGTKWDRWDYSVYDREETMLEVSFRTAWGIPYKLLEHLVLRFPDLWLIGRFYIEMDSGGKYFLMNQNGSAFWKYMKWDQPLWVKDIIECNEREENYEDHWIYLEQKEIEEIAEKKREEEREKEAKKKPYAFPKLVDPNTGDVLFDPMAKQEESDKESLPEMKPVKTKILAVKKIVKKEAEKEPSRLVYVGGTTLMKITESEEEWDIHRIYTEEPNQDVVQKYYEYREKYDPDRIYNDVDLVGSSDTYNYPFLKKEYYLVEAEHDNTTEEEEYDWKTMIDWDA